MKFDGLEAIKAQIALDCVKARELLKGHAFALGPAPFVPVSKGV